MTSYVVQTEIFEGPLDLLLSLIEKRKLFINDISLAKVADDFIGYIESHEAFPTHEAADFLLVASTLLLIKSKSLLPNLELSEEEEESIENLERRLKLYQRIKDLAHPLRKQFGSHILFEREDTADIEPVFSPHKKITVENLQEAVRRVLNSLPKKETIPQTKVQQVVSIEEMVDKLSDRITQTLNMSFSEFSGTKKKQTLSKEERVNVIVGFLAMLELVKQGSIAVQQDDLFSDIMMESQGIQTPRYS